MSSSVKQYFEDLGAKIKTAVRVRKESPFFFLALAMLVALAILIRVSAAVRGIFLIKEFDPWMQFTNTQYLVDNGLFEYFNWHDAKQWYPEGNNRYLLRPGLIFSAALAYRILTFLGFEVTLMEVCFYFGPVMGGLTVLVMYYLGKEVGDERSGLLAAFFLAFNPGHMQRTTAGFFDNETIGVFAALMMLLFFIKCMKSGKFTQGLIAGMFLGYLGLSWGALTFGYLLFPLVVGILIVLNRYSTKTFIAYMTTMGMGLLIYTIAPYFIYNVSMKEMEFAIPFLFSLFLIIYHLFYIQKERNPKIYNGILTGIKYAAIPIAIAVIIILWKFPEIVPFDLSARLSSILNPTIREKINLVASVGEHMPSAWSVFYYNVLVSLLLIIPGIYFAIKRNREDDIIMIVYMLLLYYFTGSMVRIILLFATAAALLGGYGLGNILKHLGNLMKEPTEFQKRLQKQRGRDSIGKSEALFVYFLVGILLFVQVNHATKTAVHQMSYSELLPGGVLHDWEESLVWMKNNMPGTAVVVSWWDYGYWITLIGNQTSVNDNGTWNSTRIGITGMAMMATNEIDAAKIFRFLKADYVLVYFGFLLQGLGGDEGKWPWMLRICNDHTEEYKNMSLPQEFWYGDNHQVNTVFDEDEYINSTSGAYRDKWFQSTLVKLMFYGEPTTSSAAQTQTGLMFAQELEGDQASGKKPRVDDNGNLWTTHIPDNGAYNFKVFKPAYFSSNRLVKLYKIDYSTIDSSFEIKNDFVGTDGIGYAQIKNTGITNISINDVQINNKSVEFDYQKKTSFIEPNETRWVWFDGNTMQQEVPEDPEDPGYPSPGTNFENGSVYSIQMDVTAYGKDDFTFGFSNYTVNHEVKTKKEGSIQIQRDLSYAYLDTDPEGQQDNNYVRLNIKNTGSIPMKVENFTVNINSANFTSPSNTTLLGPNESEDFDLIPPVGGYIGINNTFKVTSRDGTTDSIALAYNERNYKLSIIPVNRECLPEDNYRYDIATMTKVEGSNERYYSAFNDMNTVLYSNGTLEVLVKNTGNGSLSVSDLYVNEISYDYEFIGGASGYIKQGESRKLRATIPGVEAGEVYEISIIGIGQNILGNNEQVASDITKVVAKNAGGAIKIINQGFQTWARTDENMSLVVKNVGSHDLDLTSVTINGTTQTLSAALIEGNKILKPGEISRISYYHNLLSINVSDVVDITVNTNDSTVKAMLTYNTFLPGHINTVRHIPFNVTSPITGYTITNVNLNNAHLLVYALGDDNNKEEKWTLEAIRIKSVSSEFEYIGDFTVTNKTGAVVADNVIHKKAEDTMPELFNVDFSIAGRSFTLEIGDWIIIELRSKEGWTEEFYVKIQ